MVGLQVCLEDSDDRNPLHLGQRDVVIDEIDVRVDDRELAVGLAPEQVRGASRVVVQQLAEVHACTLDRRCVCTKGR